MPKPSPDAGGGAEPKPATMRLHAIAATARALFDLYPRIADRLATLERDLDAFRALPHGRHLDREQDTFGWRLKSPADRALRAEIREDLRVYARTWMEHEEMRRGLKAELVALLPDVARRCPLVYGRAWPSHQPPDWDAVRLELREIEIEAAHRATRPPAAGRGFAGRMLLATAAEAIECSKDTLSKRLKRIGAKPHQAGSRSDAHEWDVSDLLRAVEDRPAGWRSSRLTATDEKSSGTTADSPPIRRNSADAGSKSLHDRASMAILSVTPTENRSCPST